MLKKLIEKFIFAYLSMNYRLFNYFFHANIQFNPGSPVSSNDIGYKNNPSLEDKTSCLVNIIAADNISLISDGVIRKLKAIRQEATNLGNADYTK